MDRITNDVDNIMHNKSSLLIKHAAKSRKRVPNLKAKLASISSAYYLRLKKLRKAGKLRGNNVRRLYRKKYSRP